MTRYTYIVKNYLPTTTALYMQTCSSIATGVRAATFARADVKRLLHGFKKNSESFHIILAHRMARFNNGIPKADAEANSPAVILFYKKL